jgi:hypothetical protein
MFHALRNNFNLFSLHFIGEDEEAREEWHSQEKSENENTRTMVPILTQTFWLREALCQLCFIVGRRRRKHAHVKFDADAKIDTGVRRLKRKTYVRRTCNDNILVGSHAFRTCGNYNKLSL